MSFFFLHSAFFFFLLPSLVMDAERHPKLPALFIKMLLDVTLLELLKHPRTSGAFLVQSSWHIQTLLAIILTFFNLYICRLVKLSERWKWSRRSKGLKGCLNHEDDKPGPRKSFLLIHSQAIHYTVHLLWNTLQNTNTSDFSIIRISSVFTLYHPAKSFLKRKSFAEVSGLNDFSRGHLNLTKALLKSTPEDA